MHGQRSEDDEVVDVTLRDTKRWDAAANVVEKGTFLTKAIGWVVATLASGIGLLLLFKQLWMGK
jgi:hypothetical protein